MCTILWCCQQAGWLAEHHVTGTICSYHTILRQASLFLGGFPWKGQNVAEFQQQESELPDFIKLRASPAPDQRAKMTFSFAALLLTCLY